MLGIAGTSYFLPSLGGRSRAHADPPPIPRRIVFFYTEQGTLKRAWQPSIPSVAPDPVSITSPWSTSDHTLGELHKPLESLKDRILLLDGLDMQSAWADTSPAGNAHYAGETHALAAIDRLEPTLAGGPSIDQVIAKSINSPNPVTRLPSLELYVDGQGQDIATAVYAAAGEPIPMIGRPGAAYDRLFPDGPTAGSTPEQKAALARSVAEQRAILDFAKNDFAALGPRLGKADRERLSAHAAAVSDYQSRLALTQNATCIQPDRSIVLGSGGGAYDYNSDLNMRLVQTALACDLTRVVTISYQECPGGVYGYHSVEGTSDGHDLVHKTANDSQPLFANPIAVEMVKRHYIYLALQYAKLLKLLDSIPEADGGTLLDHTAVIWCGQIAGGDHSLDRIPYVVGGRLGGSIKQGRYVRLPRIKDTPYSTLGLAHNDFFVALANRMGVPITTFGNASVCKGALEGLS
jgi:hypothetical protein